MILIKYDDFLKLREEIADNGLYGVVIFDVTIKNITEKLDTSISMIEKYINECYPDRNLEVSDIYRSVHKVKSSLGRTDLIIIAKPDDLAINIILNSFEGQLKLHTKFFNKDEFYNSFFSNMYK